MAAIDVRDTLEAGGERYEIHRLRALGDEFDVERLPYSMKVLLENLLRHVDGVRVTDDDVAAVARWDGRPAAGGEREISFLPARVLMQDFTGVPAVVDLAAMRHAVAERGADPAGLDPLIPADLVIDHSVQVDVFGRPEALARNAELEYERNLERYQFLRWGQQAFGQFSVVPPATGICHQVNLEYLATVVATRDGVAFPDTLVGTDSHTPMVNGLGVVGWGVGGIEAEAALLGQPISMLIPQVVGFKLSGELPEGTTATDLVLTVTNMLRTKGVVGRFVEFYGPGVANVPLENRATIGNMSPEYGSTITIFPIDDETLRYLRFTGRDEARASLVEAYAKEQGLWHDPAAEPTFTETLELDLATVEPSIAGPARPQDRVPLREAKPRFAISLLDSLPDARRARPGRAGSASAPGTTTPTPSPSPPATRRPPSSTGPSPRKFPTRPPPTWAPTCSTVPTSRCPSGSTPPRASTRRPRSPSITATSPSPPSRAAPTRRTRRSWWRPAWWRGRRRPGASPAGRGSRRPWPLVRRSSSTTSTGPGCCPTWPSWDSTSWASGAPPASATRARCRPRSRRRPRSTGWRSCRCSRATATSRAASTPTCG